MLRISVHFLPISTAGYTTKLICTAHVETSIENFSLIFSWSHAQIMRLCQFAEFTNNWHKKSQHALATATSPLCSSHLSKWCCTKPMIKIAHQWVLNCLTIFSIFTGVAASTSLGISSMPVCAFACHCLSCQYVCYTQMCSLACLVNFRTCSVVSTLLWQTLSHTLLECSLSSLLFATTPWIFDAFTSQFIMTLWSMINQNADGPSHCL